MTEIPFLRQSERLSFKRCPAAWHWAWNMGLIPAMAPSNARWFGSCLHVALAEHYTPPPGANGFTRGRPMLESWAEIMADTFTVIASQKDFGDEQEKEWVDANELGAAMLTGYEKHYGLEPHWEVLSPEQRFKANIPYNARQNKSDVDFWEKMPDGKYITNLVGSLDLPVRNHLTGQVEIIDHKSSGRKVSVDYLSKDDQIGTYIATTAPYLRSIGLMGPKEEVSAVIFNFLKKAFPPDPETVDDKGTIRNKPQKKHFIAAILEITPSAVQLALDTDMGEAAPLIKELNKLTLPKLENRCNAMSLGKVWGDAAKNQGGPMFWREVIPRTRANRQRQVERIADEAEVMARIRSGDLPILKSPGEHCNWCDFKDLCDVDENGDDVEDFIKNVFKTQDPYADHRENALNSKEGAAARKESGVR